MRIPFIPFKIEKTKKHARRFKGIADKLLKRYPKLKLSLIQARMDINPQDYLAITIFSTLFWFVVVTALMFLLVVMDATLTFDDITLVFTISAPVTFLSFFYIIAYPAVTAKRRMRMLERDLLYALRHAMIEVKSGVTLFKTMVSIAGGGYGIVSEEFNRIVKDINVGTPEERALEKAALINPSPNLRHAIWQISNALKAGSDLASTLESLVHTLEQEQLTMIRKYGHEMNPWTMMYMMMGIIMPALGVTFLIVLSAFMGMSSGRSIFYLILIFVCFFQVFFLSFIKTKRPMVGV